MPNTGPVLIQNGRALPLSAEQFAAARAGRPMPPAPVAAAPAPRKAVASTFDSRAFSRADMKRRVAAVTGEEAPGSAGASASRRSMLAEMRKQGLEPVR